jgi:large subunit ribosomal protein L18
MAIQKQIAKRRERRRFRVRNRLRDSRTSRLRLSVFRSNRHIYAQIIDDTAGVTLVAASTMEKAVAGSGGYGGNKSHAESVGKLIAERALERGIKQVVFDRGAYQYHGRVASLADAARKSGLEF